MNWSVDQLIGYVGLLGNRPPKRFRMRDESLLSCSRLPRLGHFVTEGLLEGVFYCLTGDWI